MPHDEVVMLGCGGHSRSVADVLLANDPNERLIFVDDNARAGETLFGFAVVKSDAIDLARYERVFIGLGDNTRRGQAYATVDPSKLIRIVSKGAYVSATATLGAGCFVGNGAHVGPFAVVGDNTILNTGSVVEHEVTVGAHSHIGPNATISGRTRIGDRVFVGVGATIIDGITLCSDLMIGAGAVVVADITQAGTYVGVPVRKVGPRA